MKFYKDGDYYVQDTGKSPKGMKGVLMVVRRGKSLNDMHEAVVTVDEVKKMEPVDEPVSEPESEPEPVIVKFPAPSVRIVEECLTCKRRRSEIRITRKLALLISMVAFFLSLFIPQIVAPLVLLACLILTLTVGGSNDGD